MLTQFLMKYARLFAVLTKEDILTLWLMKIKKPCNPYVVMRNIKIIFIIVQRAKEHFLLDHNTEKLITVIIVVKG